MPSMLHELKHASRSLLKDRGFTTAAVVTLSICLGANSAIFTIVNTVLLKPLPLPDGGRILLMANRYPKAASADTYFSSGGDYYDRQEAVKAFEEQAAFTFSNLTVDINGSPEQILGLAGTPSLFRVMRVQPALGRAFTNDEGEIGNERKAVLSHSLWQQMFGGRQSAIGTTIRMSGRSFTIVGVMPRDFSFINPDVRVWIPLAFTAEQKRGHHSNNWYNIGRLKPGATLEQAQSQVDAVNRSNLDRFPQWREILTNAGYHTKVEPLQDMLVKDVRGRLYLLWGGAAFILLIGAVNIANLTFARLNLRRKELATRLALGAGRRDIAAQLTVESVVLAVVGAVGGWLTATAILAAMRNQGLQHLPRAAEIQLDAVSIAFTFGAALFTGLLVGVAPLAQVLRVNVNSVLREDSRTGTGSSRIRTVRQGLVVAQIGFAFVLLVGAGLLLVSFRRLMDVNPGFRTHDIVTASVRFPRAQYKTDDLLRAVVTRTLDAFRRIPGVTGAGLTSTIPFGGTYSDSVVIAEGYVMKPGESLISPKQITVSPGYLEAMGVALVRGRYFTAADTERSPNAVLVDEQLAAKFWGGSDPVGRRMYMPNDINNVMKTDERTHWLHVVGVVKPVRLEDMAGAASGVGAYYLPYAQNPGGGGTFVLKSTADPESIASAMRAEMGRIDPELALFEIRTMAQRAELSLASRRTSVLLAIAFGILALFLAAIGIYGVLAYLVTQRHREIGIRLALGSSRNAIFRLLLREGLLLAALGLTLGTLGASLMRSAVEAQIYGTQAFDPLVVGAAAVLLAAIAVIASIVPARRAMQVDPITVLNQQ